MKLTRYEQETIISFNEAEKTASVYTHNASLQRRLAALAEERPDECKLMRKTHDEQAVEYIVPKRWVKLRANRILTDEQLEAARERAARLLAGRGKTEDSDITLLEDDDDGDIEENEDDGENE